MSSAQDERLLDRLREAEERFDHLESSLADPDLASDPERVRTLAQERSQLEPVVGVADEIRRARAELDEARTLAEEADDPEMRELARTEVRQQEERLEELATRARRLLLPKDPLDDRPAVVEIRAGTGGDEAGLFASDLLRMYQRYAEERGWSVELLDFSEGIPGAVKEAVLLVKGKGAYGHLRYESGVHRVQRVPRTESQGRVHTSAATVAILPEAAEVDVEVDPSDLRVDVFRSSGPGGQSVNTTDSAVRITHVPTGLVVTCQDEKSQHKNRAKAMKVLRSRLLDRKVAEREAQRSRERKLQVGTGDRSGKVRTYNFPQNRVTDHRIGFTLHRLEDVMEGDLEEIVNALRLAQEEEQLQELEA